MPAISPRLPAIRASARRDAIVEADDQRVAMRLPDAAPPMAAPQLAGIPARPGGLRQLQRGGIASSVVNIVGATSILGGIAVAAHAVEQAAIAIAGHADDPASSALATWAPLVACGLATAGAYLLNTQGALENFDLNARLAFDSARHPWEIEPSRNTND